MTDQPLSEGMTLPPVTITLQAYQAAELAQVLGVVLGQGQQQREAGWSDREEAAFIAVNEATMILAEAMAKVLLDAGLTPDQIRAATLGAVDHQQGHLKTDEDMNHDGPVAPKDGD